MVYNLYQMALTPRDLVLSISELSDADTLEKKIDNFLLNDFIAGKQLWFRLPGTVSSRVLNEVIRRYKATDGWKEVKRSVCNPPHLSKYGCP